MTDPLLDSIRAVLDGLAPRAASGAHDEVFTLAALQATGDALRGRVPPPAEFRRWIRTCRDDALAVALSPMIRERDTWTLPERSGQDPMLPFILRRRDEAESVRAALDWRAVVCPAGRELTAARAALDAALRSFDAALAVCASCDEVDALLGERVALDDRGWRSSLREGTPPEVGDDVPDPAVEPPAAMIDAWLRGGRMSRYVQRHAERTPEFAARLRVLVDEALRDAREDRSLPVGFVAQSWRQRQGAQRTRPAVRVHVIPPQRLAAATGTTDIPRLRVELGQLAPLDASATIECDDAGATLKVFAKDDALSEVTWGGVASAPPDRGAPWKISIPLPSAPVPLVVAAPDGARVEFDVDLQPVAPATEP